MGKADHNGWATDHYVHKEESILLPNEYSKALDHVIMELKNLGKQFVNEKKHTLEINQAYKAKLARLEALKKRLDGIFHHASEKGQLVKITKSMEIDFLPLNSPKDQ